ncbi:alkaline phosphatase family protein, partial [Staphylococcus aureus]
DMGHKYGDSPEQLNALKELDKYLGEIDDSIKFRETTFKEKWLLIITTDHGRDENTGKNHGGQSARERNTWIVSNRKLNDYALNHRPSIVDIFP